MKLFYTLILAGWCVCQTANAQKMQPVKSIPETKKSDTSINTEVNSRKIVTESTVVTQHQVTIKGQRIPYKAVTGTLPVGMKQAKLLQVCFILIMSGLMSKTGLTGRWLSPLMVARVPRRYGCILLIQALYC